MRLAMYLAVAVRIASGPPGDASLIVAAKPVLPLPTT